MLGESLDLGTVVKYCQKKAKDPGKDANQYAVLAEWLNELRRIKKMPLPKLETRKLCTKAKPITGLALAQAITEIGSLYDNPGAAKRLLRNAIGEISPGFLAAQRRGAERRKKRGLSSPINLLKLDLGPEPRESWEGANHGWGLSPEEEELERICCTHRLRSRMLEMGP